MFKNIFRIAVQEAFPPRTRGRPALLGFDDAYDDIVHIVRTGMEWRSLRPKAFFNIGALGGGGLKYSA